LLVDDRKLCLDPGKALRVVYEVAQALSAGLERGLAHGDVRAGKVFYDGQSGVLADPGLGRASCLATGFGQYGMHFGHPAYLATEVLQEEETEATPEADVYALGVLFYELLCGKLPFPFQGDVVATLEQHFDAPLPPPPEGVRFSAGIAGLILRMTAKSPDERYPDARMVVQAIECLLSGKPLPVPPQALEDDEASGGPGVEVEEFTLDEEVTADAWEARQAQKLGARAQTWDKGRIGRAAKAGPGPIRTDAETSSLLGAIQAATQDATAGLEKGASGRRPAIRRDAEALPPRESGNRAGFVLAAVGLVLLGVVSVGLVVTYGGAAPEPVEVARVPETSAMPPELQSRSEALQALSKRLEGELATYRKQVEELIASGRYQEALGAHERLAPEVAETGEGRAAIDAMQAAVHAGFTLRVEAERAQIEREMAHGEFDAALRRVDAMRPWTIDEAPLRRDMLAYSARILQLSLVISLITAVLVFFSLRWLLVRPMARLTRAMTLFREKPEEAGRVIRPSGRRDEVGVAETELAAMQTALRSALHQRARLAALGEAVAKINHDLRNILATAQLLSDRLRQSEDPEVRHVTPTLFVAIDRAVGLASRVVEFARTGAPSLRRSSIALAELVADAGTALPNCRGIGSWINRVPAGLTVMGDREELLRVLNNLARNAFDSGARRVEVGARARDGWTSLTVTDDGPGIPEDVRQSLFQPFATSSKAGSSGLGLAIAREVMHAHGGEIQLVQTGPRGTTFRLDLPSRDLR